MIVALGLSIARPFVPTDPGLSWDETFKAAAHIFVGVMLALLWMAGGNWPFGWFCLGVPTLVELVTFLRRKR